MKRTITMMLGTALLLGVASSALAQDNKPSGISLRAGLFLPTDRGARDVSDSWFAGGIDYKIKDMGDMNGNSSLGLSLDFTGKGGFRTVPLLLNYIVHRDQLYFFGGAGISFSRFASGGGSEDKTEFAYQAGAGYEFQKGQTPLFFEAKFMGNGRSALNGFGFFIGARL
ncbi:hypothetical protein [Fimbriimonas ginsengisoli]|uniref:Outer membrane protein beta-barrel domain-containing protein n=1 Tax=Fimbriimonas ginsengisoli Gsoil 348 TaxID=661478 RepID=A0A068NU31_FIMGI|nr:hypothetical protein [Fimbriimonas ginsengisoli]AIE86951.1 hypothetical protein OP10G_3583 [Fimbriimonas ginsengisoli Gsoil 348]